MRLKTPFLLLFFGLGSLANAAWDKWETVFSIPVSYRIGALAGKETDHLYIGTGIDAGMRESLLRAHVGIHTYVGPLMFADMNQPNEVDLGPQLAIPLDGNRRHVLTLGAGPALFFSGNGSLSSHKAGGYLNTELMNSNGGHFRWGPFLQYSLGKTDIQETNESFPTVRTSGIYAGCNFQYALKF